MLRLENIKVIFIDIDKTLTDDKRQVPKENSLAIKRAKELGKLVVLCSGRGFSYAGQKAKEACASELLITSNGAQIYDFKNHKSLYENKISKETVKKLLIQLHNLGVECILNTSNTRFGTKNLKRKIDKDEKFFNTIDDIGDENILQIVCEVDSYSDMKKLIEIVDEYRDLVILNFSRTFLEHKENENNYYADINNCNVNKGEGVKKFLEIFNIKKEEALCFGDYINDVEMFDACGYKVAMGNASENLKAKADYITLSNNEAGVAYFINNYILK